MVKKVKKESMDITEAKLDGLNKLLPEAFTEGKIDFDKLRRSLGDSIDEKDENLFLGQET